MRIGLTTAAAIATLSLPIALTPAQATGVPHSTLRQGARLTAGQSLRAAQYSLTMQADGDLVLHGSGRVLWRSGTAGRAIGGVATVRADGALAVRNRAGRSIWATRPAGRGAALVVQTDGNVVLRTTRSVVWRTGRAGAQTLSRGATLRGMGLAGAVFDQINAARVSRGVPALRWNPRLATAAHRHNLAMAASGRLSHRLAREFDLGPRITAAGYRWRMAGENIGQHSDTTAQGALVLHRLMMAEVAPNDGHRRNILSRDYTEVGVDVHRSAGQLWLTQDFGRR